VVLEPRAVDLFEGVRCVREVFLLGVF
jgi:hypothetical protein